MDLRFAVVGGVGSLRPGAARAAAAVCHLGVPPSRSADIELAVHEGLANALEHGHAGDGARPIDVEVERDGPGGVIVTITDGTATAMRPADRDRGRGRALMQALSDASRTRSTATATSRELWWSTAPPGSGSAARAAAPVRAPTEVGTWLG